MCKQKRYSVATIGSRCGMMRPAQSDAKPWSETMFDFSRDPEQVFLELLTQAEDMKVPDANAMVLSTADARGRPASRVVLFKGMVRGGLSFYTNYEGKKAHHLAENPYASVLFFWPTLERQIRVEGKVVKLTREESAAYFKTRPRLSQIGAWASRQSRKISDSSVVAGRVQELDQKFTDHEIDCPDYWGGYHLIPNYYEFWFGRQGRLHERFVYEQQDSAWSTYQLSP
ncbi:Pyridoxamine 5\'-phosphate oxidase [gamma proteobacterium HdN1]|nr:Pyridoxamine 5\'-phosphate oxidase [gamma proteobacterium HdN1]